MIIVDDLSFTYTGTDKLAVKQLSFEIQKGGIWGFLGPSGAGKSTTQKIYYADNLIFSPNYTIKQNSLTILHYYSSCY